jgi:hypothetical protein
MRSLAARIIVAIVLLAAAWWARAEAQQFRARAATLERIATLSLDAEGDADSAEGALSAYWRGAYDALTAAGADVAGAADARTLLIAANAAYRAAEQNPKPRAERVQQLDAVLQAYTSALKAPEFLPDAAYNYEFVVKLRDSLARARGGAAARGPAKAEPVTPSSDLPTGNTIHGRPGAPPPEMKGEEFEILTPMEYGDRETQPEPTPGAKPLRKG